MIGWNLIQKVKFHPMFPTKIPRKYGEKWGKMWNCGEPQNLHNKLKTSIIFFELIFL